MRQLEQTSLGLLFIVAALLSPARLFAESGPLGFGDASFKQDLETDRPDFTEGTQTIETGHLQLEAGYTFTYDKENESKTTSQTFPEYLLRLGLEEDLEFRLAGEGYAIERTTLSDGALGSDTDLVGTTDLTIGYKQRLRQQSQNAPSISYLLELGLPVGSQRLSAGGLEPALKFLFAQDLTDRIALGANLNFASLKSDRRFLEFSASATIGYSISDSIGSYLEYYGFYPEQSAVAESETHYFNGGVAWSLSENAQLDLRAGFGLNSDADDFFTGAGFAWRV